MIGRESSMNTETMTERIERCQAMVTREPQSAAAHFNLALAYTARGQVARAEQEYREAVACDPDLVEAWVNLGGTLLLKWDFEGAVRANEEALRRRPDLVEAHYNLGQAHLYRAEAEPLVACCARVVALAPEHAAGHYFMAVGLLALGRVAEARAAVTRAVTLGHRPQPDFLRKLEQAEAASNQVTTHRDAHASPSKEN